MSKIKIFVVAGVLSLVAIVSNISPVFVSKAEDDQILQSISGYKNWAKVTKEPIAVDVSNIAVSG